MYQLVIVKEDINAVDRCVSKNELEEKCRTPASSTEVTGAVGKTLLYSFKATYLQSSLSIRLYGCLPTN